MSMKDRILVELETQPCTLVELSVKMPDKNKDSIRKRLGELILESKVKLDNNIFSTLKGDTANEMLKENESLKKQLAYISARNRVTDYKFDGDIIRIGIVSDTHLGSTDENIDLLNSAYDMFESEGIYTVFHAGDLTDGEHMRKGHEYGLKEIGYDKQTTHALNVYPYKKTIKTILIGGNHDESFYKHSGADICSNFASKRDDIEYIGMLESDARLNTPSGNITLRLWHPLLGTAYSISYHPMRYVEALSGGAKPHILVVGNFHKAEWLFYRNIHVIQPGCMQFQTIWMRGKRISAQLGFCILECRVNENGISRLKFEFFPDYNS